MHQYFFVWVERKTKEGWKEGVTERRKGGRKEGSIEHHNLALLLFLFRCLSFIFHLILTEPLKTCFSFYPLALTTNVSTGNYFFHLDPFF